MATILLLNGPNLNTLGQREPSIYGATTLKQIEKAVGDLAREAGHQVQCFQSNSEGDMVDWLHKHNKADFLLINAGAYTHTSVALRDAILAIKIPFIEIHISNVHAREDFRGKSYLADIAVGIISGLGPMGYELATSYALDKLKSGA